MTSMGMDKSGTHELVTGSTWVKITGWVARSGFPGTVITNNALVMDQVSTGTFTWRGQFNSSSGTQQFRVVKNGTTVIGSPANNQTVGTAAGISVAPGDTFELQGYTTSTVFDIVQAGAAVTYLYFTQTSTAYNIAASDTAVGWDRTAAMGLGTSIGATPSVGWTTQATMSLGGEVETGSGINWNVEADTYLGQHYSGQAERNIAWNIEASALLIPKVVAPPTVFASTDLSVSVHTADGRAVGAFPCTMVNSFTFGRELNEISIAEVQVATQGDPDLVEDLRQWVHWITLWLGDTAVWTGPIWHIRIGRAVTTIRARDTAIFGHRTRLMVTRTFADTSPARIADYIWRAMLEHHGIRTRPVVLPGVADQAFTLAALANSEYVHSFIDKLVNVGLQWTVAAGVPILGEFSMSPVADLQECDFLVEIERQRDGSQTFNDVRIQGQNYTENAIVELAGLKLQALVSMDSLSGAANIQRAALQYVKDTAKLRDDLVVPGGASLHPQAPVTFEDLIPGKVFALYTETAQQLMKLDAVQVTGSPEAFDVQITLIALEDTTEFAELSGGTI